MRRVISHRVQLSLIVYSSTSQKKNGFKYPALYTLLINIFILKRKHNLYLLCWARYVSICSIYFICQKVAKDFCQFCFAIIEDIVLIEFIK